MKDDVLDKIVLAYLRKKNYRDAEAALLKEAKTQPLEDMIRGEELDVDACIKDHIHLYTRPESLSSRYLDSYRRLRNWVHSSLDIYKHELLRVLYPIFVHCYLQLVSKKFTAEARQFLQSFREEHEACHHSDIKKLEGIRDPQHLKENALAQMFLQNKFNVRLCQFTMELLMAFLHSLGQMQLLSVVNEHLNLQVFPGQPGKDPEGDDAEAVTLTGSDADAVNSQEIKWGTLEGSVEQRYEEKVVAEAAEAAAAEGPEGAKRKASDGAKLGPAGVKKAKAKGGKAKGAAPPAPAPRVQPAIPLPTVSDEAEAAAFDDLRRRVQLSASCLPSVCMYTVLNHHNTLNCLDVSHDGALVAGGFSDSSVKVWDMSFRSATLSERGADGAAGEPTGWRPDSTVNAGGASSSGRQQRPLDGGRDRRPSYCRVFYGHSSPVYSSDWSPDGEFLLTAAGDATVRLWSMELSTNLVTYRGHNYPVWDARFSPLGHYLATASHDRTARIWSVDHGHPLRIMAGHLSDVDCVRWHVNCNYIATGSSDKTVRLWDVQSGDCLRIFTGHRGAVQALAMSPCGRFMASGDEDGAILLWDLGSGRRVAPLMGHTGCVWSLAFSREASLLASGSADCTVRLWDVSSSSKAAKVEDKAGGQGTPRRLRHLKTLATKYTPVYTLQFTGRNLLFAAGAFSQPKQGL